MAFTNGQWAYNSFGEIMCVGAKKARMYTKTIPEGMLDTWTYCTKVGSPDQLELQGKTSCKIQVGWIYEKRGIWRSEVNNWYTFSADMAHLDNPYPPRNLPWLGNTPFTGEVFKGTPKPFGGGEQPNFTLIPAGQVCAIDGRTTRSFWKVTPVSGRYLDGVTKVESPNWAAISNGDGTFNWVKQ